MGNSLKTILKKLSALTVIAFVCSHIAAQQKINVDSLMGILIQKLNDLPVTNRSGPNGKEYRDEYRVKWRKRSDMLLIKSNRFTVATNKKTPDSYRDIIPLKRLHPDGVHLKFNNDSSAVLLILFTANNEYSIVGKNYVNGWLRWKNYSDRYSIGGWDTGDYISKLVEIKELLQLCISLKTNWGLESYPDQYCMMNFELIEIMSNCFHSGMVLFLA
jgi:hypothetical protein